MSSTPSTTFLLDLCDYRVSYLGCFNSLSNVSAINNQNIIAKIDIFFVIIDSINFLLVCYILIFVKAKGGRSLIDYSVLAGGLAIIFHSLQILFTNLTLSIVGVSSPQQMLTLITYIRGAIVCEFVKFLLGSLMLTFLTVFAKKLVTCDFIIQIPGTHLRIDLDHAMKFCRILIFLMYFIITILFCSLGLNDLATYVVYRNTFNLSLSLVCLLISAPVLGFYFLRLRKNWGLSSKKSKDLTNKIATIQYIFFVGTLFYAYVTISGILSVATFNNGNPTTGNLICKVFQDGCYCILELTLTAALFNNYRFKPSKLSSKPSATPIESVSRMQNLSLIGDRK